MAALNFGLIKAQRHVRAGLRARDAKKPCAGLKPDANPRARFYFDALGTEPRGTAHQDGTRGRRVKIKPAFVRDEARDLDRRRCRAQQQIDVDLAVGLGDGVLVCEK